MPYDRKSRLGKDEEGCLAAFGIAMVGMVFLSCAVIGFLGWGIYELVTWVTSK